VAWDLEDLRVGILEEFGEAYHQGPDRITLYDQRLAYRRARDAEAAQEQYARIKLCPVRLKAYNQRKYEEKRRRQYGGVWFQLELPFPTVERERGMREKLPDERSGPVHHFVLTVKCTKCERRGKLNPNCSRCKGEGMYEVDGYLRVGCYADGRVGEIFLTVGKIGDRFAIYDSWCKAFSIALQFGAPLIDMCRVYVGVRNEISGATASKAIPRCTSIEDYCARWLLSKFAPAVFAELRGQAPAIEGTVTVTLPVGG
jgi:hypothetical protein